MLDIILLPFKIIWALLGLMGRMLSAALGVALMIVGIVLTITVVGAAIGVPIIIIGLLLTVRSFF